LGLYLLTRFFIPSKIIFRRITLFATLFEEIRKVQGGDQPGRRVIAIMSMKMLKSEEGYHDGFAALPEGL
jgi:hypothetical protein